MSGIIFMSGDTNAIPYKTKHKDIWCWFLSLKVFYLLSCVQETTLVLDLSVDGKKRISMGDNAALVLGISLGKQYVPMETVIECF